MSPKKKDRLDNILVNRGLVPTRAKAKGMILAGDVLVDGERVDKAGTSVLLDAEIEIIHGLPYVGRGGFKLAGALAHFNINLLGRICADVGACTGGFTDVMLQKGASQVFAIDVGYGQLDWSLRQDKRVTVMERTNARYLESLAMPVSFVAIDVSFISLRLILPAVKKWLDNTKEADIVALIKPQFEAGRSQVGKGGVIRDTAVHRQVLIDIVEWCHNNALTTHGLMRSTLKGADGNIEFLIWLKVGGVSHFSEVEIDKLLNSG